jgi:hypothetical protein
VYEKLSLVFGCVIVLLNITAIVLYFRAVRRGTSTPNPASWLIWSVVTVLNALTYQLTTGDWVKGVNSFVALGNCTSMLVYCLWQGKMRQLEWWDRSALLMAGLALLVWAISGTAWLGNAAIQLAIIISFSVTVWMILTGNKREHTLPWLLWTACHSLTVGIVVLRWKNQPEDLIYPVLGVTLNAFLTSIAWYKNRTLSKNLTA